MDDPTFLGAPGRRYGPQYIAALFGYLSDSFGMVPHCGPGSTESQRAKGNRKRPKWDRGKDAGEVYFDCDEPS